MEANLRLNTIPIPTPKPNQHLIRVISASVNPVDYKPAETPLLGRLVVGKDATPGTDLAGELIIPAAGSPLKPGQLVYGCTGLSPFAGGTLAEYVTADPSQIVALPAGVSTGAAATLPVAASTAYQSVAPHVRPGDHVFLNGGSGGVGLYATQILKALGCHVTVTCSTRNVALCRAHGADEAIDYTRGDVVGQLAALPYKFDHAVDNVGSDFDLYWQCHRFTTPAAKWVFVASSPTVRDFWFMFKANTLPTFLGGQSRPLVGFFAQIRQTELEQFVAWMAEGKLKAPVDSRYSFEKVQEAYKRQKTGRVAGKVLIDVAPEVKAA